VYLRSVFIPRSARLVAGLALLFGACSFAVAQEVPAHPAWENARPVIEKYCYDCHGGKKTKGSVNLKELSADPAVAGNFDLWEKVREAIDAGDMPPEDDPQPDANEKDQLVRWLGNSLEAAATANAGDPGMVTMRRLTNAEYDLTIRDLTGVDFGLAKSFLQDGGGGEGFSNIGDVLFVSPQQLDKYLGAARQLTEHASILPGRGIMFQKERVGLRSPVQLRDQAEQALYIWYQKMSAPFLPKDDEDQREAEYMLACWKFKHREQTGAASLEQLAKDATLSPAFLDNWWALLTQPNPESRFLDLTRVAWRELPGPDAAAPKNVPAAVTEKLADIQAKHRSWTNKDGSRGWVQTQRRQQDSDGLHSHEIQIPIAKDQPLHLIVGDLGDGNKGDIVNVEHILIEQNKKRMPYLEWLRGKREAQQKQLADLQANPAADQAPVEPLKQSIASADAAMALFGKHPAGKPVAPEMLVLQAPIVVTLPLGEESAVIVKAKMDMENPDADLASFQWTATGSNPPDPTKIIPGVMTIWKRQTDTQRRVMNDFSQMKAVFPDEYNRLLEEVARNYRRKDGKGPGVYYLSDAQLGSLISENERANHQRMLKDWRILNPKEPWKELTNEWDQSVLGHLTYFAARAWRRPLSEAETDALTAVYYTARGKEMDRESAGREVLMRVFISPDFIFKLENSDQPGEHKLNAFELATRLSYFLWSSLPDNELQKAAADGSLLKPEVLQKQTLRMLKDWKSGALAEEFAGQWLKFHGFSKHSTVDATKFPEFTPELRADMHLEAQEFFKYLVREDRPVKDILLADYTFLNERLAKHYGVPEVTGGNFRKVTVSNFNRGGILGMGSILTKTSFPQRSSPVLRGDWLLHAVLGMPTPPPPPDVPQLDDVGAQAKTVREKLEAHRQDKACASCHDKIDPLGFALESFDAIGRFRTADEGGIEIDNSGELKDGTKFKGIAGLREYLGTRDKEFHHLLCRKLIGYSLGRSVMPSDKVLIETMSTDLKNSDDRFSAAILTLVQSRQFQYRRNE